MSGGPRAAGLAAVCMPTNRDRRLTDNPVEPDEGFDALLDNRLHEECVIDAIERIRIGAHRRR